MEALADSKLRLCEQGGGFDPQQGSKEWIPRVDLAQAYSEATIIMLFFFLRRQGTCIDKVDL